VLDYLDAHVAPGTATALGRCGKGNRVVAEEINKPGGRRTGPQRTSRSNPAQSSMLSPDG
jgi:hypothetical protein